MSCGGGAHINARKLLYNLVDKHDISEDLRDAQKQKNQNSLHTRGIFSAAACMQGSLSKASMLFDNPCTL